MLGGDRLGGETCQNRMTYRTPVSTQICPQFFWTCDVRDLRLQLQLDGKGKGQSCFPRRLWFWELSFQVRQSRAELCKLVSKRVLSGEPSAKASRPQIRSRPCTQTLGLQLCGTKSNATIGRQTNTAPNSWTPRIGLQMLKTIHGSL